MSSKQWKTLIWHECGIFDLLTSFLHIKTCFWVYGIWSNSFNEDSLPTTEPLLPAHCAWVIDAHTWILEKKTQTFSKMKPIDSLQKDTKYNIVLPLFNISVYGPSPSKLCMQIAYWPRLMISYMAFIIKGQSKATAAFKANFDVYLNDFLRLFHSSLAAGPL